MSRLAAVVLATTLMLTSSVVVAQNMIVSDFIAKADALKAKGAMAMFSGDIKVLTGEIKGSFKVLRAQNDADKVAKRKPMSCVPHPAQISSDEIITSFKAIPADQRQHTTVQTGINNMMAKRYPCP